MGKRIAYLGLIGMLCLSALAPPAAAQNAKPKKKKPQKINVDFNVGWNGCYRPRQWTPVTVGVTTPFKQPLDCMVRFSCPQDELNTLDISRREVFMPNLPRNIHLVTRMNFAVSSVSLKLLGTDTSFYWAKDYELWNQQTGQRALTVVEDHEILIGLSGSQGFSIMQLPQASMSRKSGKSGSVYAAYRFQRLLPSDWTAYASLDLLVLYDVEWVALTTHQQRAIAEYVNNGGRMLMVLGAKPLPAEHTFARMLPLSLKTPKEIQLSRRDLSSWNCEQPKTNKVACWQANMVPGAHGWAVRNDRNGNSIYVSGPVGFGKVGVLLFDPATIGCRQGKQLADFWLGCMKPLMGKRSISLSNNSDSSDNDYSYQLGTESAAGNAVLEYLYSVEELRPIHIGWVVLVLTALAVLIGPVDYLVLKAFGRLPWTWITSTACIAVFSVGAYYGVEYLRGGVLQARVVSVVDSVDGMDGAWATRYMGIFAPHSDDYRFSGQGPQKRKQWWSGMAPTQNDELYYYRQLEQRTSRNIYCEQHIDGGNWPISVPINIWSMQCLSSESRMAKGLLSAKAKLGDGGQWTVTVQNNGEKPISRAYLRVGRGQAVELGKVPPGESREVTGRPEKCRSWQDQIGQIEKQLERRSRHYGSSNDEGGSVGRAEASNAAEFAQGVQQRTYAMMSYIEHGAVVLCAEYDNAPVPYQIADKDCRFQHTLLARLVVFPEGRK